MSFFFNSRGEPARINVNDVRDKGAEEDVERKIERERERRIKNASSRWKSELRICDWRPNKLKGNIVPDSNAVVALEGAHPAEPLLPSLQSAVCTDLH